MTRDEVRRMLQEPNTTRDKDKPRYVAPHTESDNLRRRIAREMDAKYGDPGRQAERRLRDCEGNTPELPEVPDTYKPEPDFVGGGGAPEQHPWRFVTQDSEDSLQWGLTDSGPDGTRAGRVLSPDGTYTPVDSEWNDYTKGDAVSAWLKVTCSLSSGLLTVDTAEIVTEEPTADPFNATAPIFVWPLFDLFADGTFTEYQTSDISLEGLLAFDDTATPEDIVLDAAANGTAKDPARKDHKHKFPPGGTQYQVLQNGGAGVAVWDDVRMTA